MPQITDIKPQKRPGRYSIYVDGKYSFPLTDMELSASSLRVGAQLSAVEVAEWHHQAARSKTYDLALRYLALRPRSEYEMRQYLKRREQSDMEIDSAISRLLGHKYLDDEQFGRSWVSSRQATAPRSTYRLTQELRQKGLDQEVITKVLSERESDDQQVALRSVIIKKRHTYGDDQKLIAYLSRQGFKWDDIKSAIEDLTASDDSIG